MAKNAPKVGTTEAPAPELKEEVIVPENVIVDPEEIDDEEKEEEAPVVVAPIVEEPKAKAVQVKESKPAPVKEATAPTEPKLVRIHTTEPIDCMVAQVTYKFPKDKDVSVPSDVAAVLCSAKKAYRN